MRGEDAPSDDTPSWASCCDGQALQADYPGRRVHTAGYVDDALWEVQLEGTLVKQGLGQVLIEVLEVPEEAHNVLGLLDGCLVVVDALEEANDPLLLLDKDFFDFFFFVFLFLLFLVQVFDFDSLVDSADGVMTCDSSPPIPSTVTSSSPIISVSSSTSTLLFKLAICPCGFSLPPNCSRLLNDAHRSLFDGEELLLLFVLFFIFFLNNLHGDFFLFVVVGVLLVLVALLSYGKMEGNGSECALRMVLAAIELDTADPTSELPSMLDPDTELDVDNDLQLLFFLCMCIEKCI